MAGDGDGGDPEGDAELIEAAAIAIQQVFANRSGRGRPWEALPEAVKRAYRHEARGALVAAGVIDPAVDQSLEG